MEEQLRVIAKAFEGLSDGFRGALAVVGAFAVNILGGWDWALFALVCAMVGDVLTGGLRAWLMGDFNSRDWKFGIAYKVFMLGLVAVACLIDYVLTNLTGKPINYIRLVVILWYFLGEVASILENMAQTGFKYPAVLLSGLRVVRAQMESIAGEKSDAKLPGDSAQREENLH